MALNEQKLRAATPLSKPYKLWDGDGLYALVQPSGSIWWRVRYRFQGSDTSMAIGVYPGISLLEARKRRDAAKRLVASGVDPGQEKKKVKEATIVARGNTFAVIAEQWLQFVAKSLSSDTVAKYRWQLETFVYPEIGDSPISELTTQDFARVVRKVQDQGLIPTAHGCKTRCQQVCRYARSQGISAIYVSEELKGGMLPVVTNHHPAITDPRKLGELLRDIYSYSGKPVVKAAFKLSPMLFPRPENMREMEWTELDFTAAEWFIPRHKMKGPAHSEKQELIVPLPTQAIEILTELRKNTGCYKYVFPNDRGCMFPMSNNSITYALKRIGYGDVQSWHGFRATARTMIEETLGFSDKWAEMQLAHKVKDPNGRAYNRTAFLQQRHDMMQRWADYLDELRLSVANNPANQHGNLDTV